jgi:CubicO group peptidase (beta-lactamase class C family)
MSEQLRRVGEVVQAQMQELGIPGIALGVLRDGDAEFAGFGVNNVDNPQPVDQRTLFRVASISKTFTATAAARLVEQGKLDFDAPLRRYVPELRLADPDATERVTLRHALNHYGGWKGDVFDDFGRGDDALARYVAHMAEVPQWTKLGTVWSYNNAGFCLAGRAIELAYGKPFEQAVRELLLEPLGTERSFYFAEEMIAHRVSVGHTTLDGVPHVTTPWVLPRAGNAMGGLVSCVEDLMRWARFQMGDGAGLLKRETLDHIQGPLAPAGSMADWIGVGWQSLDVGGTRVVQHGGAWLNQFSTFRMVPERGFAVVVLTNANRGAEAHGAIGNAALKEYLGIASKRGPLPTMDAAALRPYFGRYDGALSDVELTLKDGGLVLEVVRRENYLNAQPESPMPPPVRAAFFAPDRLFAQDAPFKGTQGDFLRDEQGNLIWFRWGGRIHRRRS